MRALFLPLLLLSLASSYEAAGDDVDLPLPHIVIVGATGVGKSSLASVLIGESPLCKNCTFPVCPEGGGSCTNETSFAVGPWLKTGPPFTIVDTPGFQDSDDDDGELIDQMMTVLKESIRSANTLLLLLKGTDMRLDSSLQQMLREMEALFGEEMWDHVVIGVSFWKYDKYNIDERNRTCQTVPEYCHDEEWFKSGISSILETKFHIGRNLPFAFIDSWAKHPNYENDTYQQEAFYRETDILWKVATSSEEFFFKSVQDVLNENHQLKAEIKYLRDILEGNITEIKKDITDIKIHQGHSDEELADLNLLLIAETSELHKADDVLQGNLLALQEVDGIMAGQITDLQTSDQNLHETIKTVQESLESSINSVITDTGHQLDDLGGKILTLETRIDNAFVNFAVEGHIDGIVHDKDVTYTTTLSDSHMALNIHTGYFTAPMDGAYTFFFHGLFHCDSRYHLYAKKNGETIEIFQCYEHNEGNHFDSSSTVMFTMKLNAGDVVCVNTGKVDGSHASYVSGDVRFSGFLLPSFL